MQPARSCYCAGTVHRLTYLQSLEGCGAALHPLGCLVQGMLYSVMAGQTVPQHSAKAL